MNTNNQESNKNTDVEVGQCKIPASIVEILKRDYFIKPTLLEKVLKKGALNRNDSENSLRLVSIEQRGKTFDAHLKIREMGDKRLFGRRVAGAVYIFDTIEKVSK